MEAGTYYRVVGPGQTQFDPGQPLRLEQIEESIMHAHRRGLIGDAGPWKLWPVGASSPRHLLTLSGGRVYRVCRGAGES